MDTLGSAVEFPTVFQSSLAVETSHHFIDNRNKIKIAANIFKKEPRKAAAAKPPVVCPYCGKEACNMINLLLPVALLLHMIRIRFLMLRL